MKEKDLGVTMNAHMKVSEQCRIAASKGNQVLGMIRRNITYKDKLIPIVQISILYSVSHECRVIWCSTLADNNSVLNQRH